MKPRMVLLIVLVVLAVFSARMEPGAAQAATAQADPTQTPTSVIAPVQTVTPRADGSLVHVVGFGQTLAEIAQAYGVTMGEIQRYNGLPPDSTTLYSGQKLLILPARAPNPLLAVSATNTPVPTVAPTSTATTEPPASTLVAPAAGSRQDNNAILPIAGGLILLGGFLLLAAALVIRRRRE